MKRKISILVLCILTLFVFVGCQGATVNSPQENGPVLVPPIPLEPTNPDIVSGAAPTPTPSGKQMPMVGVITEIALDEQGNVTQITVENTNPDKKPYEVAIAVITATTQITKNYQPSALEEPAFDLDKGQKVEVMFKERPVLTIYPPRIEANLINIIE